MRSYEIKILEIVIIMETCIHVDLINTACIMII